MAASGQDAAQRLGRYTIFGEIAAGGMATVCFGRLAGEAGFAKTVAIKRLHAQFARDDEFREMFAFEAGLAARIRHPNVVQTLDVVKDGGELFLVMEYVHGESLSRLLKSMRESREATSPRIAAAVMSGALHGLHAAHEAKSDRGEPLNLVHRDVSPQNILVGVDGAARVIDFGIAKARSSAQHTREGEVRGKLPYMAPEQFGTAPASRRTDVYAAAVVLWEMLAGRRLFEAGDDRGTYAKVLAGARSAPSDFANDIPRGLDAVVMQGLALDPRARFATARDMALAIEETIPLANGSHVGAWVEHVARDALATRARRLVRVESAMSTANFVAQAPASVPVPAGAPPPARPPSARPPPTARPPTNHRPPPNHGPPATPVVGLPPPDIDPMGPPRAGIANALPAPAVDAGAPAKRSRGTGPIVALGFLLVVSVGSYVGVPALLAHLLVSSARAQGLSLVIGDVGVSLHALHLRGVELTAAEVPGARVVAPNVDLSLHGFSISGIEAREADVSLDGAVVPTLASLVLFQRFHVLTPAPPFDTIVGENVRFTWTRALGDATRIVIENAHVEVTRAGEHAFGEDVSSTLGLFKVETPVGTFGPYSGTVTRDPENLHGTLRLDATGAANLKATWVIDDGSVAVQVDSSPLTLPELGVPLSLGRGAQISGTGRWATARVAATQATSIDTKMDVTLRGIVLEGSASEMRVEAEAAGNAGDVLPLTSAWLTLDGARVPVQGTIDASGGLRVDAKAQGPRRLCPGAEPTQILGELTADVRHLEDTHGKMTSLGRCAPRRGSP